MNVKAARTANILCAAMLLLNVCCVLLNLLLRLLLGNMLISLPAGVFVGLAMLLPSILLLVYGIKKAKARQGRSDLVLSIVTLTVSAAWMCAEFLYWIITVAQSVIVEFYFRMDIDMSVGELLALFNYVYYAFVLFTVAVALYLLIVYVIGVLRSGQRRLQLKAELYKPALAILLLGTNLFSLIQSLFSKAMADRLESGMIEVQAYVTGLTVMTYTVFALNVLLTVAMIALLLSVGLIFKKQPVSAQATPQAQAEQPVDVPFDLPAGVSADHLS